MSNKNGDRKPIQIPSAIHSQAKTRAIQQGVDLVDYVIDALKLKEIRDDNQGQFEEIRDLPVVRSLVNQLVLLFTGQDVAFRAQLHQKQCEYDELHGKHQNAAVALVEAQKAQEEAEETVRKIRHEADNEIIVYAERARKAEDERAQSLILVETANSNIAAFQATIAQQSEQIEAREDAIKAINAEFDTVSRQFREAEMTLKEMHERLNKAEEKLARTKEDHARKLADEFAKAEIELGNAVLAAKREGMDQLESARAERDKLRDELIRAKSELNTKS